MAEMNPGRLTVYDQIKVTAVKLIPGRHLTSVRSREAGLSLYDLHLKGVDLKHRNALHRLHRRCQLIFATFRVGCVSWYLGVAVVRLLQLQVFPGLAGEVHPLPLEPLDGRFLQQRAEVHLGHKRDGLTCTKETPFSQTVTPIHTFTLIFK